MEELIAKHLSGNAFEDENQQLKEWMDSDEQYVQEYLESKEVWIASAAEDTNHTSILENIINEKEVKVIGWPSSLKYAAAIVLLGMIGFLWYFGSGNRTEPVEVFSGTYETLEDGTIVSLSKGASIVNVVMTDDQRLIEVSGKVFFEVEHDEDRPFYVATPSAKIKVLGTSFLVNSNDELTEVCVETGSVQFSTKGNMSLDLTQGEMGMIGTSIRGIIKKKNDDDNFLSWKSGLISFQRTLVKDVVLSLEKTYDVDIELSQRIKNCRLTADFNKNSIEEVIQTLSATFNWEYEINEDKVVLSGEGC